MAALLVAGDRGRGIPGHHGGGGLESGSPGRTLLASQLGARGTSGTRPLGGRRVWPASPQRRDALQVNGSGGELVPDVVSLLSSFFPVLIYALQALAEWAALNPNSF